MTAGETEDSRTWLAAGGIALVLGLALRLSLAAAAKTPGHGDSAFYYTVAKNIVDGRGLVVDYVVYFFSGLVPIPHYAGDFWNPLAEILLSLPMLLLGKSVFNALLASIVAGIVPALVAYFAALRFTKSVSVAVMAGVLTFLSPYEVWVSALTEAIIFFGAFGSLALLFAIKGRLNPRMFLIAALCTGLAHLVRQDGILLLLALLTCIVLAPIPARRRLMVGAGAVLVHALVVSPLVIRNLVMFGSLMQPGPASTMFMTSYEDFHAYGTQLDWPAVRAEWGIRGLITRRLHTAGENLAQIKYFLGLPLLFLASLGVVNLFQRRRGREPAVFLPILAFAAFEYAFYTIAASFSGPGTLPKALAIALPFICILVVDLLDTWLRPRWLFGAAVAVLAAYCAFQGYRSNYRTALYYNWIYEKYGILESMVVDDAAKSGMAKDDIVIMARDVWDVYEGTGLKTVMIPNNDLDTILFVAAHYDARYMLLPAPRKALEDIYLGTTPDPRFIYLGSVPETDWSLFRIQPGVQ